MTRCRTIKFGVMRLIHLAHPTRTDLREDLISPETCTDGDRHFFNPADQLNTTMNDCGTFTGTATGIRKRFRSGVAATV
jgi:hypothetical protein